MYHRFKCIACGKTFTSIDPSFLPQLQSIVSESFPFITSSNIPGMYISMIHQFYKLATNKVLFSTYINIINEMHSTKYYKTILRYYDCNYELSLKRILKKLVYPNPFPPFEFKGEYNKIKLTKNLVRHMFIEFMRLQEGYIQKSF